jgi:hypothetical protein
MAYPDFYAAKREDVPDYARAAYLESVQQQDAYAQKQKDKQAKWDGAGSLYRGMADSMPEGKTPISEALRMGKAGASKVAGMFGPQGGVPNPQASPGGGMGPGPGPVSSALPGTGRAKGTSIANQLRKQPAPAPVQASTPPARQPKTPVDVNSIDFLKGTGIDVQKAMPKPAPMAKPTSMPNPMLGPGGATGTAGGTMGQGLVPPVDSAAKTMSGTGAATGGTVGALTTAANVATAPTTKGKVKAGVGGVGMTGLSTAGPALAAAGPVGWAGLAGLAAMSLYGMLA